jgi:hypothetical protein
VMMHTWSGFGKDNVVSLVRAVCTWSANHTNLMINCKIILAKYKDFINLYDFIFFYFSSAGCFGTVPASRLDVGGLEEPPKNSSGQ